MQVWRSDRNEYRVGEMGGSIGMHSRVIFIMEDGAQWQVISMRNSKER